MADEVELKLSELPGTVGILVRYGSTIIAGWFARRGYISDDDTQMVIGALIGIATTGWALWAHRKQKAKQIELAAVSPEMVKITQ